MTLELSNPQQSIDTIIDFLRAILIKTKKNKLLVAVSGGVDSALSLTMAVKAAGSDNVHALLMPYKDQSTEDSEVIAKWNNLPAGNIHQVAIDDVVGAAEKALAVSDQLRLGNVMARVRMIALYDLAKQLDAIVCGTENKSEKLLGYFTRFGDEASDIEPLQHLYKTQVRQLAKHLQLPPVFLQKAPTAGLWHGQTDEQELGFSYQEADQVLAEITEGEAANVDPTTKQKVLDRVKSHSFKLEVPYTM